MKVVVAHNQYSSDQPSGQNVVVAEEIANLTAAGVTVLEFLRSSDEIPSLPLAERAALPLSPVYARRASASSTRCWLNDSGLLHAPAQPLPVALALGCPHRPRARCTGRAHGPQLPPNLRHLHFRDGAPCHDCVGRALPIPAVQHGCYRGSRAQSAVMAAALTVHRGTWRRIDRMLALTPAIAARTRWVRRQNGSSSDPTPCPTRVAIP